MRQTWIATAWIVLGLIAARGLGQQDHIGHTRHLHRWGEPHAREAQSPARFITSRDGRRLDLPREDDAFFFVVFGDRTGGPADGVSVLADAVRDTNLLEPDFVMTVGDLVQGYNRTPQWLEQMREYRAIMDELVCPWFPVAGNHDIYWRGEGRPAGEHERDYEMHFGPLWYAFTHKNCMFIALYSDEGNPETGEKAIDKPASQVMSDEQFAWLRQTLERGRDMDHIFIFLHHPRWLGGNYGDDWERVHRLLVEAGNVSAVFAGHIHRMRYDPRDGIDYIALATVGGGQSGTVPEAGWLHHFNIVTVRRDQIAHAAIPVGEVMDVREITGEMADHAARLSRVRAVVDRAIPLDSDAAGGATVRAAIVNPTPYPVDATLRIETGDGRWLAIPDHQHLHLQAGQQAEIPLHLERLGGLDRGFGDVELVLSMDMLLPGHRYAIPESRTIIPLQIELEPPAIPARERALEVDGVRGVAVVPSSRFALPDGPFTLECWFRADGFGDRTGLVAKTENAEYGIFVSGGVPSFSVLLGRAYAEAKGDTPVPADQWHHVAGVYDGHEVRLYVDGEIVSRVRRSGRRRTNARPLMIGADVDGSNNPMSFFDGRIDGVRLSRGVRYTGDRFEPVRRFEPDDETVLLFNMDALVGPWLFDESASGAHATVRPGARIVDAERGVLQDLLGIWDLSLTFQGMELAPELSFTMTEDGPAGSMLVPELASEAKVRLVSFDGTNLVLEVQVDQRYRFEGVVVGDRMIGHWRAEQDPSIEVPMTGRRRVL